MTDRVNSLTVALAEDVRSDDIEPLVNAILHFKGVATVGHEVLKPLFARLVEPGGRYLLSVALTHAERDALSQPTYGGKGYIRWLTDEEYAAMCGLLPKVSILDKTISEGGKILDRLAARIGELEAALRSVRTILQSDSVEYDDMRAVEQIIDEAVACSPSRPDNLSTGPALSDGAEP